MPTVNCKPQGNGTYTGWSLVVGAPLAWQAIDDSDTTTHDSASSYIRLPRLIAPGGTISFPFFRGWEGALPTSVTVNLVAQRVAATHPRISIGFVRGANFGFDPTPFDAPSSWGLAVRVFDNDPITGQEWNPDDLPNTEIVLQSAAFTPGNNDVTLLSASVDYSLPHNYDPILPMAESLLS
jgi:hypothetical protein